MVTRYATYDNIDFQLCSYCGDRPVFEHFTESCFKCSFVCEECEELVGYEKGAAGDELCDDCWAKKEKEDN